MAGARTAKTVKTAAQKTKALAQSEPESTKEALTAIKLVGAHSYTGSGIPLTRKGGTRLVPRAKAERLIAAGLFVKVEE